MAPLATSASNSSASRRRNVFSAMSSVFQITAVAFSTFLKRLAAAVRSRTAAKGDSTGVRRREMLPVLTRELVKRHHPFPVAIERAPDLGVAALGAPRLKRALLPVGVFARLRVRDLREQTPRFRLPRERQLVEHVQEAMVPAPLLLRLRKHRGQGAPDPEMAIADHQLRCRQPAALEVAQDRGPAFGRFPIATLDGEDHLLAVAQRG